MIPASRFLIRSTEYEGWLEARRNGVSATAVASAATPAGFRDTVDNWGASVEPNEYMLFGNESEPELMRYAHQEHGILPSDWIIRAESDPRWIATPDGIDPAHTKIAEAKTTGKIPNSIPRKHRDQMFWQMFCTDTERGLYVVNDRVPDDNGWFYLGRIEPVTYWLERDDTRIGQLVEVAERLWEATRG